MLKDDIDTFVVNMKMLVSILGHNEEAIKEKFKDIFPERNIEAALVAMDDITTMQAKAKQLVMIYKPTQESATASTSLLVHMAPPTQTDKGAPNQDQNNQHQLAPIQNQTSNRAEETLPMLEEIEVKIEVEEVPWDIITTVIDLKIITGDQTGVLLDAIIMANKEIEIINMSLRIGRIGHGIT